MKPRSSILALCLAFFLMAGAVAGIAQASPALSGNVPLGSYVYDYIDKLDGLGLMRSMPPGDRPYTRLQVAGWVSEMESALKQDSANTSLVQGLLNELRREFAPELAHLTGYRATEPQMREWKFGLAYYNGDSSGYSGGRGTYQPLNRDGQGYGWNQGMNAYGTFLWEGALGPDALISVTPRIAWGEKDGAAASLQSGYMKLHSGNTEFLLGKDAMAWGQGRMGNLLLSDNATPLTRLQISNIEPLRYRGLLRHLGAIHTKVFVGVQDDRRYWSGGTWKDVDRPGLYGMRLDFQPSPDFTFGAGYTSMFGGKGINMGFNDYLKILTGRTNAWEGETDKWNGIAGVDFRWRFPSLSGLQLYGEYYSEDNIVDVTANNSRMIGWIGGIYVPRLSASGDWDLGLEFASTGTAWYVHSLYTGGYTYGGQIIGDAMGGDANRYSAKVTHYLNPRTQIGLRLDRVTQGMSRPVSQRMDAIALSLRQRLGKDLLMEFTGGFANRDNAGFTSGVSRKNKFVGWSISQRF